MVAYSVWKPLIFSGQIRFECFDLNTLIFKQEGQWQMLNAGGCRVV